MKHGKYLQKSLATLGALSVDELLIVQRTVESMLVILRLEECDEPDESGEAVERSAGAVGYVERKMIRGFGPYLYLRRWKGKTLTSTYIGKARG